MNPTERLTLRPVVLLLAGNVLFATGLIFHAFLYNFYLEALHQSVEVMGHAAAALTGGGIVMLLPAGVLADRAGHRVALVSAAAVLAAGLVLGAVAATPAAAYGAAVLAGAGSGIWRVALGPILMGITEPSTRARAFAWNAGLLVGWSGLGTALSGAVSSALEGRWGLDRLAAVRAALILGAVASTGSMVLFRASSLPGSAARRPGTVPSTGAAAVPPTSPGVAPPTGPTTAPPASPVPAPASGPEVGGTAVPFSIRGPLPLVGLVALWMLGPALGAPFFNLFFSREHGLSIERVGFVFAAANLGWALAVFTSGEAARRVGVRRLLMSALLFFAPAMWGLSVAGSVEFAVGLFFLQGLVAPVTNPLIDQWLLGQTARERHGVVSGWRQVAADASAMIGASLGGRVLAAGAFDLLFLIAAAIGLIGALGLIGGVRATRRRSNPGSNG